MRRSTAIAGTVAVLIAIAVFFMVKMHGVASAAGDAVYNATGVKFTYSGLPGISFWPETAVTLDNVALASASGSPLVTAAQMRLVLDRSLFTISEPAIASITLNSPRINMTMGRDGKPGWVFGNGQSPAPAVK